MKIINALLISLAVLPMVLCNPEEPAVDTKSAAATGSHNLIIGQRKFGDRLLFHNELNLHRKFLGSIQYDVKYPSSMLSENSLINYIEARDLKHDGTGGYPSLYEGGINHSYATIRLKSQWNHGLHFNVSIYGHN